MSIAHENACGLEVDRILVDRTQSSRMGWSDISISLSGKIVPSLITHFIDRW